jgi:hypothetical protein
MRELNTHEVSLVAGGEGEGGWTPPLEECGKTKNNNGYGNGPEAGPPPGNSGAHNPQLTGWNAGPLGLR